MINSRSLRWKSKKYIHLPISKFFHTIYLLYFSNSEKYLTEEDIPSKRSLNIFTFSIFCFFLVNVLHYISCFIFYGQCNYDTFELSVVFPIIGQYSFPEKIISYAFKWVEFFIFFGLYTLFFSFIIPRLILFRLRLSFYFYFSFLVVQKFFAVVISIINYVYYDQKGIYFYNLSMMKNHEDRQSISLLWNFEGSFWPYIVSTENAMFSIYTFFSIIIPLLFFQMVGKKVFNLSIFRASLFSILNLVYVFCISQYLY